jgi:hypothetical protein
MTMHPNDQKPQPMETGSTNQLEHPLNKNSMWELHDTNPSFCYTQHAISISDFIYKGINDFQRNRKGEWIVFGGFPRQCFTMKGDPGIYVTKDILVPVKNVLEYNKLILFLLRHLNHANYHYTVIYFGKNEHEYQDIGPMENQLSCMILNIDPNSLSPRTGENEITSYQIEKNANAALSSNVAIRPFNDPCAKVTISIQDVKFDIFPFYENESLISIDYHCNNLAFVNGDMTSVTLTTWFMQDCFNRKQVRRDPYLLTQCISDAINEQAFKLHEASKSRELYMKNKGFVVHSKNRFEVQEQ